MRSRRRFAPIAAAALLLSSLTLALAPGAGAANPQTLTSLANCSNTFAPTVVFNLPLDLTTTVTDLADVPLPADPGDGLVHIEEGDQFKVSLQGTIPLSEGFIAGVLVQVPTLTQIDVQRIFVSVPAPAGATGGNLNLEYTPGVVPITSAPGVPIPGGVALPSPTVTQTYTATAPGGTTIDFDLDQTAKGTPEAAAAGGTVVGAGGVAAVIEMDLQILGVVNVGFDCEAGGLTQDPGPDTILGTPDDLFVPPVIPNAPFLQVAVDAPPVPTVNVSDVTGQSVTNAARAGNTLTFGGPNWAPSTAITVELCDLDLVTCDATGLSGVSAAIDGTGVLSGTATVDPSAGTGARALVVSTDQAEQDDAAMLVLGAPTISAPGNAGEGAPITITGTNWNPGSVTTAVQFLDATDPLAPISLAGPFVVTVDQFGAFSTTQTVVAGMNLVGAGDADPFYPQPPSPLNPGSLAAVSPFQVSADECTVLGSELWSSGGPIGQDCSIQQTVLLDVLPGTLSMSQTGGIVDLGDLQLDGTAQYVSGAINQVTVVDATGSLFGWDLTATMTDLENGLGAGNNVIPAANMEWTPSCDPIDASVPPDGIIDGNPAEVASGAVADLDNTVAATLCTAAPGGGGGTFTGDAGLNLFVDANVAAGSYQATLTLLLM